MPPSSATRKAASPSVVRAAANFGSPIPLSLPARASEINKDEVVKLWSGSVVRVNTLWLQYAGVEWNARSPAASLVLFSAGGAGDTPKARLDLGAIMSEESRARVCKQIIFGALAGTFQAEGVHAKITGLAVAAGKLAQVQYDVVDSDGDSLFSADPMPIGQFFKDFHGTPGSASGQVQMFDFQPYPQLLGVMRAAGAIPEVSTTLPTDQARTFLEGIQGGGGANSGDDLSAIAAAAEAAAKAEKASPALRKLKRAASAGGMASAPLEKKAKVVRSLAMNLKASEELPPPPSAGPESGARKRAAKKPKTNKPRPPGDQATQPEDSSNDSDSGSSDDEDDEPGGAPAAAAANAAAQPPKRPRPAAAAAANKSVSFLDAPEEEAPLLTQFTPPGSSQVAAARVIFEQLEVREAARCAAVPPEADIQQDQQHRLAIRYDMALGRLREGLGSRWQAGRFHAANPQSVADLERLAEELLDAVITSPKQPATPGQQPAGAGGSSGADAGSSGQQPGRKPAEGISADKRAAAVLPGTAQSLHAHESRIQQATADGKKMADVTALISDGPAQLRDELRRALASNGSVDNQGEVELERRALPPSATKAGRMLGGAVALTLEAVPKADVTGQLSMTYAAAEELARKVVEGRGTWDVFDQAAAAMRPGGKQKGADDRQRLQETWSLVKPAYSALQSALAVDDPGIAKMDARLQAAESQSRLSPEELSRWAGKVLSTMVGNMAKFRLGLCGVSRLDDALPEHESSYTFDAHARAFEQRRKADLDRRDQDRRRREEGGRYGKGTKGKGKGKEDKGGKRGGPTDYSAEPPPPKPKGSPSGWPEKKVTIPDSKFGSLKAAALAKYKDTCAIWLIGKCTNDRCSRKHEPRPTDFEQFLSDNELKLDGSAKCTSQQLPNSARPLASAAPHASVGSGSAQSTSGSSTLRAPELRVPAATHSRPPHTRVPRESSELSEASAATGLSRGSSELASASEAIEAAQEDEELVVASEAIAASEAIGATIGAESPPHDPQLAQSDPMQARCPHQLRAAWRRHTLKALRAYLPSDEHTSARSECCPEHVASTHSSPPFAPPLASRRATELPPRATARQ